MKIGLFGGTFNPPHLTHINIAKQAIAQLGLDKLLIVPCGNPPHKRCDADKRVRLELARLAFESFAEVWDYEILKESKSYTVETLREAKKKFDNSELYLIIGGDSLRDFDKWYCPEQIARLATIAVADRGKKTNTKTVKRIKNRFGLNIVNIGVKPDKLSSTEIRLRYQFGKDNSEYVPESVNEYILKNGLYSEYRSTAEKLATYLKPERLEHTFYVVKRGLEFAADNEYDKVFTACLLHDCAKYIDSQDYAKYGFVKPDDMPLPVVHSFLGAKVAEKDFGVTDTEILDAIKYHTTGRPAMTRLEKIVYVADKTEETRPYPLSHLLKGSLDSIFLKCLDEANEYRIEYHGDSDYALTDETLRYYLNAK